MRPKLTSEQRENVKRMIADGHSRRVVGNIYKITEAAIRYIIDPQVRKRSRERAASRRLAIRDEMIAVYGGCCQCCAEARPEFLAIDHIHGAERNDDGERVDPGGASLYEKLKKLGWPKGEYRLLCHNCNMAREMYGECPHERELREELEDVMARSGR